MERKVNLYCRFCVEPKHSTRIFHLETDEKKREDIQQKLAKLACPIDFTIESALPKTVCSKCYGLLTKACSFVQKIQESQTALNNIFLTTNMRKVIKLETNYEAEITYDDNSFEPKHEPDEDYKVVNVLIEINATSWKSYIWSCKFCVEKFNDLRDLRAHFQGYHNTCNGFKCSDCDVNAEMNFSQFIEHVVRHRPYLKKCCLSCEAEITTSREEHMATHMTTANRTCVSCGEIHTNSETLTVHQQIYNVPRKLIKTLPDVSCYICSKMVTRHSLRKHLQSHDPKRTRDYACEQCGRTFFEKNTLINHMVTHADKTHPCKICPKVFASVAKLKSHIKAHIGLKAFECNLCKRTFRLKGQLVAHKKTHLNERMYKCSYCPKSFNYSTNWKIHERQHTGYKPYSCDECDKLFTNWSNYNKHMKRIHKTDLSKLKHTAQGMLIINPTTGDVIENDNSAPIEEWKNEIMKPVKKTKEAKNTSNNDK